MSNLLIHPANVKRFARDNGHEGQVSTEFLTALEARIRESIKAAIKLPSNRRRLVELHTLNGR